MTTRWKFILSAMIVFFFFGVINLALGGGGAIVKIALVAVGLSLIWSNQNQRLIKAIVSVAVAVAVWTFLSLWGPTQDSMEWLATRGAMNSPRNNFNPTKKEGGKPVAESKAVICDGKVIKRVPLEYNFDPDTGCQAYPMTSALAQELLKLEGKTSEVITPPVEYKWCYYMPPGVKGEPWIRARCLKASVDVNAPSVLAFSAYQYHGGELTTSTFFLNRTTGEGRWQTNNDLSGSGDWYELPVVPGTPGLAFKGQFRDETKDNAWIPFDIITSGGSAGEIKQEEQPTPLPTPPTFQVRSHQPTA